MNKKDNVIREKELKEMYVYISANDVLDKIVGLCVCDDGLYKEIEIETEDGNAFITPDSYDVFDGIKYYRVFSHLKKVKNDDLGECSIGIDE